VKWTHWTGGKATACFGPEGDAQERKREEGCSSHFFEPGAGGIGVGCGVCVTRKGTAPVARHVVQQWRGLSIWHWPGAGANERRTAGAHVAWDRGGERRGGVRLGARHVGRPGVWGPMSVGPA
jgi:hypothetical protein